MLLDYDEFESPIGRIVFASNADGICGLGFEGYEKRWGPIFERRFGTFELRHGRDPHGLKPLLRKYFAGDVHILDSVQVTLGGAPFQQRVWKELQRIPAGKTVSYSEVAKRIGFPKATRAVARACGANTLAVAIPCHRVVRNSGDISGYRWGVERKQALLTRERMAA